MHRASLSAENRIASQLSMLRMSARVLCAIAGTSATQLSRALVGAENLGNDTATKLLDTLERVTDIVQAAHPLPIDLRNARPISELLILMRQQDVTPTALGFAIKSLFHQ